MLKNWDERAALAFSTNCLNSAPCNGRITSDNLSPRQMGFSSWRNSANSGLSDVNRPGAELVTGRHALQVNMKVARSADKDDLGEIVKRVEVGMSVLFDLYAMIIGVTVH